MLYKYSEPVDHKTYRNDGLAHDIPLRVHKDSQKEITGARRAQEDWSRLMGPIDEFHGVMAERFSMISVTIPECLPERLEIVSYANEFAFLYDDQMEQLDLRNFEEGRDEMLHVFTADAFESDVHGETRPEKTLQLQVFSEMMAIDHDRAITTMKAWAKFIDLASRTRSEPFETLEEYLPVRAVDVGQLFCFGTITFAMALTIPASELDMCMRLTRPAYEATGLVNDLYSWQKERLDAEINGQNYVFNAIWVIMQENDSSEQGAIEICQKKIRQLIGDFDVSVNRVRGSGISQDALQYLDAVRLSHVGNLVWSIYSPRYSCLGP